MSLVRSIVYFPARVGQRVFNFFFGWMLPKRHGCNPNGSMVEIRLAKELERTKDALREAQQAASRARDAAEDATAEAQLARSEAEAAKGETRTADTLKEAAVKEAKEAGFKLKKAEDNLAKSQKDSTELKTEHARFKAAAEKSNNDLWRQLNEMTKKLDEQGKEIWRLQGGK